MSGRFVWALLLLGAVFSMHGIECAAADANAGHGTMASAGPAIYEDAPSGPVDETLTTAGTQMSQALMPAASVAAAAALPHRDLPTHGAASWMVCLAALLTGAITLAAAALIGREPASLLGSRAAPVALWHTGWSRLPRPPELAALCLLRI